MRLTFLAYLIKLQWRTLKAFSGQKILRRMRLFGWDPRQVLFLSNQHTNLKKGMWKATKNGGSLFGKVTCMKGQNSFFENSLTASYR